MKNCTTYTAKGARPVLTSLLLIAAVCSGVAQESVPDGEKETMAYANYTINLASNLNFSARAVPIENINSNFSEYKPALTLHGNRLYFSRALHPDNTGGVNDKEDIWYADIDKENNNATMPPKRLEGHLNNSGPNFVSG